MFADHVRVVPSFDGQISTEVYWGELIKRTENLLTLETPDGSQYTVEVVDGATVEIPSIPGPNTVNRASSIIWMSSGCRRAAATSSTRMSWWPNMARIPCVRT
ncbi:MAG: hypothetical protein HND48_25905 [Chloroflexi bacterium]|nr:hypothetical protein [Chloroflexota bacterium]